MHRFFRMRVRNFEQGVCWGALKSYWQYKKQKKRVWAHRRNTLYRAKLKRLFKSWFTECHLAGQERIREETAEFRKNLETEKLTMWTEKVDQLMLYMGQLENKIKQEVAAREQLAHTYEQSLNKGAKLLNQETGLLADNPLVQEISLVVAKHLMEKGLTSSFGQQPTAP